MAKSNKDYDQHSIEKKWRKKWEESKIYQPNLDKAKKPFYNLMMFPYPSAEGLHVGSVFTFTGVDTYGRFKRMQGFDVFEPMGLDGFGIHSENYALKVGRHPRQQARVSESNFYRQLKSIGNGFDWSRKVETYDPAYYKWTQWIFIQLFKRGLAYRKKAPVNFCPKDLTVLADEQVLPAGRQGLMGVCERCSSIVEKRELEQWFFKITDYADRLLNNIPKLNWTEKVKIAQREWIGRSEGVMFRFKVKDMDIHFEMFDSVPQTHMAQTFTVIAPEHPKVYELVKGTEYEKPVMEFVEKIKKKKANKTFDINKETEGVFTGRYIDYTPAKRLLPIWVASFVIAEYGTGVVNSSAHDERDFAFAKKYNLPLHPVMFPEDPKEAKKVRNLEYCYHHAEDGILEEPGEFKGRKWGEVREDIIDYIEKKGYGKKTAQYHLRDWLISRQRYWGPPIPMIYCKKCDWQPVPEDQLPVLLPDVKDWRPKGRGISPLANHPEFYKTKCPNCEGPAERETDVSDTFLDSSWYFFRYISTEFDGEPFDKLRARKWLPVTMYIGGAEHSVLHLLYSRFITMVFKDMGLIDFEEPYRRFYAHGLIIKEGRKMSKSRGNVVNPDDYLAKYGADTLRAYLRFVGPYDSGGDFRDSGIEGMHRFLKRVWKLVTTGPLAEDRLALRLHSRVNSPDFTSGSNSNSSRSSKSPPSPIVPSPRLHVMYQTIKGVTEDLESLRFNTAMAKLMTYYNFLSSQEALTLEEAKTLILLLAPFTPFLAEELWQQLQSAGSVGASSTLPTKLPRLPSGSNMWSSHSSKAPPSSIAGSSRFSSVHLQPWPSYDPKMLAEEEVTVVVQVNGKVRDTIRVKSQISNLKSQIENEAKKSAKVRKYLDGKKTKRIIFIPGKLINFVSN